MSTIEPRRADPDVLARLEQEITASGVSRESSWYIMLGHIKALQEELFTLSSGHVRQVAALQEEREALRAELATLRAGRAAVEGHLCGKDQPAT